MEYGNIYMLGIGGIGMSAIARYFHSKGLNVSGYDRTPSDITASLQSEGIAVHFEERPEMIPGDSKSTLAIYTPAIPEDNRELEYLKEKGFRLLKRSKVLGEIAKGKKTIAVAGTHGKTTTSTMIGHIFQSSGTGCDAFLGGISKNYGSNLLLSDSGIVVAEADEFDRSFLQLFPDTAIITSVDADHLDIYHDYNHVMEAFCEFAAQTERYLILKEGLPIDDKSTKAKIYRYSYDTPSDFYASGTSVLSGGYFKFDLNHPGGTVKDCIMGVPGRLNAENGVAAAAAALLNGIDGEKVKKALGSFLGVKRRMDIRLNTEKCSYIDDYAHHPKEIEAAIKSIRDIFPGRRITAVFQPHLYTRTRDFAEGFASSLSKADRLILLDIYPARELPIEGVTSRLIFDRASIQSKILIRRDELMQCLEKEDIDVLVTFGAGDIDRFTGQITDMLKGRIGKC